jgi:phospholipase D1/2
MNKSDPILTEGHNCWRSAHADRVSFLIDAQAYFDAFASAIEHAEQSIIILSWDIDSQARLRPQNERQPCVIIDMLNGLVAQKPSLHIYILNWDYAPIYAFERETAPTLRFQLKTHRRIHFVSDTAHPYFASLHQKVVVIDDTIAFSGGLDLTGSRWDTPDHEPDDPRRLNRKGSPYAPFHDVQIVVDDEAARALGVLARERWWRATGQRIPDVVRRETSSPSSPWPTGLPPDLSDSRIAIARTEPCHDGRSEVREVENAYLDSIAAAQRFIYAETQYLTSESIRIAIARRLSEPDGPEIVLVTPKECCGFFEKQTMGVITARLMRDLKQEDVFNRLRLYSPRNARQDIYVHAKVMVIDDLF